MRIRGYITRNLGLDVGDKRIGVALSDPLGIMASPYTIIECEGDEADIEAIVNIITRQEVGLVIVGLPHSKIGDIGVQAKKVMGFALKLKEHISVPVEFRDERLTTVLAKQLKKTGKNMKSKDKVRYDDVAAAIILQTYLDETYSNNLQ